MSLEADIVERVLADFPPDAVSSVLARLESVSATPRVHRCIVFAARGHSWYFAFLCRQTRADCRDVIMAAEYVLSDVRLYDFTRPFQDARIEDPYAFQKALASRGLVEADPAPLPKIKGIG